MDRIQIRSVVLVVVAFWLSSCQSYEPVPLDPAAVIAREDRLRQTPGDPAHDASDAPSTDARGASLRFSDAAAWLLERGPGIRETVASYRTALARSSVATPLPNPGLEVGPQFGFGNAVRSKQVAPFGSLGITIPLSDRRLTEDLLNHVRAEVARVTALTRHRELYLELRRRWVELLSARKILAVHEELVRAAEESAISVRRSVEAGQATALDVAIFALERGRSQAERVAAMAAEAEAVASLSVLVGVNGDRFASLQGDEPLFLPDEVPSLSALKEELVAHHPALAILRASYEEAEAVLRHEIEKQLPDFKIGPSFGSEVGESKVLLGLSLGIELPLFDQNQQAIAEAAAHREEVRVRYEAAANRALAELERVWHGVNIARTYHAALTDGVMNEARRGITLARESLAAGAVDGFRLLDAERSLRRVTIETERAALDVKKAWSSLELATGKPLFLIPTELEDGADVSPKGLVLESASTSLDTKVESER